MRPELTQREKDILTCLVERLTDKEIAKRLVVSVNTVQWYNRQLYDKLQVKNRREAATYAVQQGLLDESETPPQKDKHNLPASTTPFVGRTHEKNLIKTFLDNDQRLITILAPGGMGKTRLALEIGRDWVDHFRDGVYFVPLQSVADASQIMAMVGTQLALPMVSTDQSPEQQVLNALKTRQSLLIMDNYEHLLDGAHWVTQILEQARDVRIIVTSRERLNLQSESIIQLTGLPHDKNEFTSDAVTLFIKHVQRLKPGFELQDDHHQALDYICALTEGMPLALLLAATWANTLTIPQISNEIKRGIGFLQNESGDLPRRHQAIRSVFEPTWKRLNDAERLAFSRLSIFAGGCTLEAAIQVTGANVVILRSLVNKALITLTENGRYEIHELLRQYAEEKLRLLGDEDEAKQAHAEYYATLMRWYGNNFFRVGAFNKIMPEMDNIRVMWWHLVEHKQWRWLEMTMIAFRRMMNAVANYQDLARWFQFAMETLEHSNEFEQEQAIYGCLMGCLVYAYTELRHVDRKHMHDRAFYVLDDCELNVYSAYLLLNLAMGMGSDTDIVLRTFDRVVPIFKQANFSNGLTIAYIMRMFSCMEYRDLDSALDHGLEAIAIAEQGGDLAGGGWAKGVVGEIMLRRYQYHDAITYSYQYYDNFRRVKMLSASTNALELIARIHLLLGENDIAISTLEKSIEQCRYYNHVRREIQTRLDLCTLHLELEQIEQAQQCFDDVNACIQSHDMYKDDPQIKHFSSLMDSWLGLLQGNYDKAKAICRHALTGLDNTAWDYWFDTVRPLLHHIYGQVQIAQHELAEAQSNLITAIRTMPPELFYKQLQAIMIYAQLLDMEEQTALLSFVANHPGTTPMDRDNAHRQLEACAQVMDGDTFAQAVQTGQRYDLTSLVANLS